jgi:alcohol dehydrogenase YqhD (iron-dependent ADH family)
MKDFNFYAPTRVVFGRESEEKLPQLIQQYGGGKVLVHYGGNSAKRSGLLNKLHKAVSKCYMPKILRISTKWQENKN